jgi:hypothetical protein
MDMLKASKESVKKLKEKEGDLEGVKEKRKAISSDIGAKDKEIDAVSKDIDIKQAELKAMSEKDNDKRSVIDEMFKERDSLKKAINTELKKKDASRDAFRKNNNAWFNNQRAVKAQKQMQYEEEKKVRDEERQAYLIKAKEEEMKKIPYEEEQALCDYLAEYLERTYLKAGNGEANADAKKEEVVVVEDDPFAKFKPSKKVEEEFFSKGKGKKKRTRQPKKLEAGPFTLNVDTFEQFSLVGLNPPTSAGMVAQAVEGLREKKEWYSKQPRGSVPTANDTRKANEKATAKLRQAASAPAAAVPSGKFSASDADFAPLGKGASSSFGISAWGQGQKQAPPSGEAETNGDDGAAAPAEE